MTGLMDKAIAMVNQNEPEPFTVFFLLLNICPLSRLQPDLHCRKLGYFGGFLSKCGCLILMCLIF
jgi:hypothetical protein